MAVTYVTLYPPGGNSAQVQVVEGSQLHLIYAAMGFSAIPSAPGPPVRPDPFPQYVHDDEIGDLLADAAVPATDPVVAALLGDGGSQTRAALDALDLGGDPITPEAVEANLPSRLSDVELRAAFAVPKGGGTIVLFGNSRLDLEDDAEGTQQRGMFTWANQMLRQRAAVLARAGVSADTLTGMIARFPTDVVPHAPAHVLICDAVNDISAGATLAQVQDRYQSLIDLCRGIRARAILTTIAPNSNHTTGQKAVVGAANRWLKSLTDPFVLVVDVAASIAADTGMAYATGYATDGLHQSRRGAARMGRVIADTLDLILPKVTPLPSTAGDPGNAVSNPLVSGTVGAGVPSGWDVFPGQGASVTYSIVARTDQGPGNWFQAATAAGGFPAYLTSTGPLAGVAVTGDYVEAVVEVTSDAGWSNVTGDVRLYCQLLNASSAVVGASYDGTYVSGAQHGDTGDATAYPVENQPGVGTPWVFRTPPLLVPSTATQAKFLFEFGGQGVVRLGRAAIRKV